MIVWAKKESLGTPNNQRVEIIKMVNTEKIIVEMCGNGDLKKIKLDDITRVEFEINDFEFSCSFTNINVNQR